ncbi:MAG: phage Gp37/Gp68 family protein [Chloroflexi bacterium]|nr:phage Gp37/Gp68 family protein [Chloroflexota bacterium]
MGEVSKIEWTDATFNPWRGCTKVSEGCRHCYAETLSARNPKTLGEWGPAGRRAFATEAYWKLPVRWNREAERDGFRKRVFCASLSDVFELLPAGHPDLQAMSDSRCRLWRLIEDTPWLDWLLLTKRPENCVGMATFQKFRWPDNVWLGTSVENQEQADKRIPQLLTVPAKVRFLSCEPLLGPVNLGFPAGADPSRQQFPPDFDERDKESQDAWLREVATATLITRSKIGIHWVIVGGESGPGARRTDPEWARQIIFQSVDAGVPVLFKQWGEFNASGERVGKKAAGRVIAGQTWDQYPRSC